MALRHRYLVVLEVESPIPPTEDSHDYMFDFLSTEQREEITDEHDGGNENAYYPASCVEVVSVKEMGRADQDCKLLVEGDIWRMQGIDFTLEATDMTGVHYSYTRRDGKSQTGNMTHERFNDLGYKVARTEHGDPDPED